MKRFKEYLGEKKSKFKGMVVQSLADFLEEEFDELEEAKLGTDIPMKDYDKDEMNAYLDRAETRNPAKSDKFKFPRIHGSSAAEVKIVDESGSEFDLDKLAKMITTPPNKILKKNEKMQNSIGESVQFYNIGLPAIKGLLYDEDDKKFKIISTCPNAGECKLFCYAHKGGYVQWKNSSMSATKLLNLVVNHPDDFVAKLSKELKTAVKSASKDGTQVILRWHDTGDFFSNSYKEVAFKVAKAFPEVKFYAYTKNSSASAGAPDNFVFNFSAGAKDSETAKVDFATTKNSRVIMKNVFIDLVQTKKGKLVKDKKGRMQYISDDTKQELKKRVAKLFKLKVKDILTYDELMKFREGKKMKWSVIVAAGDGDDAAARRDVRDTLLLIH